MVTTKEILESEPEEERHEKLEALFCEKLNQLKRESIDPDPRLMFHPEISVVEKNFMVITEEERGFSMSGGISQYSQGLEQHAHRWEAVGMSGTAFAIRALAKRSPGPN